jgi:hypothetical protein
MQQDRLQAQRFERKYFITEPQVAPLREFISGHLQLDENSEGRDGFAYPVHSIYLDSHELLTYWATVHCEKKRFKLRVRFYDDGPEAPLFFEIKRRENECVLKQRGMVRRSAGALLLAGQLPCPEFLVNDKPHHLAALQRFSYLMQRLNARPMVHVGYRREAWVSPFTNAVRVTIDRAVRGEPRREADFSTHMSAPISPFGNRLILELKFTDRFPDWFADLVRHFNLLQVGVPKYCGSVAVAGEQQVMSPAAQAMQQKLAAVMKFC